MNTNTKIDELIAGYFAQGLDTHELSELREWLLQSNENKLHFKKMQEVWFSSIAADDELRFNKEIAFQRFLSRTKATQAEDEPLAENKPRYFIHVLRAVAAVAVLVLFVGGGYWFGNDRLIKQFADISIEAPLGSRTKTYLPDGTLVWLNAGTKITYSQGFGVHDRKLELNGECYFEVTKNPELPFDVKTNNLTVRVLGTKFNFRDYTDEMEAKVTLLEGKVSLNNPMHAADNMCLFPNQQAVLDKERGTISISSVKAQRSSEWTLGLIFFNEEKLPDIAKELERYYNVKIVIADDSIRNLRFYGNFTRTEQTIQEVLGVLASTNRLSYKIGGKNIVLFRSTKNK
jgi:transmembrane sensor